MVGLQSASGMEGDSGAAGGLCGVDKEPGYVSYERNSLVDNKLVKSQMWAAGR